MVTTPAVHPVDPPPPREITDLARLCLQGDLEHDDINLAFQTNLQAYSRQGHQMSLLWTVLFAAVQYARPRIFTLLLSQGLQLHPMYVEQAVSTGSKEVFQAFLDNGWNVNEPLYSFRPPVLA